MQRIILSIVLLAALVVNRIAIANAAESSNAKASESHVIQLSDQGLSPQVLNLTSNDLMVFLLNNSSDALVTFEIEYGKSEMHCSAANVKNVEGNKSRSINPLGPRDFVAVCFHDPGTYPIRFWGLKGSKQPLEAKIVLSAPGK